MIFLIKPLVSFGKFPLLIKASKSSLPVFAIAFFSLPSPQLYAISAKYHFPKFFFRCEKYENAASVEALGSLRSSTNLSILSPKFLAVTGINCQIPAALTPEVALFDSCDSTIAR